MCLLLTESCFTGKKIHRGILAANLIEVHKETSELSNNTSVYTNRVFVVAFTQAHKLKVSEMEMEIMKEKLNNRLKGRTL